jgi:hypothetical protein
MDRCFVIQPFDKGKFDQRYKDSFKQAIEAAGLEPYRVDSDMSVRVPIEDIEKRIRESVVCFADISIDNPNVWYELGYAFACGKDVVMVCSDEREGNFPFDIAHKFIIRYQTRSKSDFSDLEKQITSKLIALSKSSKTASTLNEAPVVAQEGLTSNEIALLIFIAESSFSSEDTISIYNLKSEMGKAGYTDIATSVAFRSLRRMGMIETLMTSDYNSNEYVACLLTDKGEDWLLSNQDKLIYRKGEQKAPVVDLNADDDDLPF